MLLAAGTRIGPYEVLSPLGAGGMGEVYRARDSRLNRDVAIKVLLPSVANDPDRLARFEREAQLLASLNHPNIAHIHGIEEVNGAPALAMELVEGPTLADRIALGAIPLGEALPIARQIADALEAAHEQGIVHRDLKPANIKVRPDGAVKVLDFGLAKAMDAADSSSANAMMSPTLTAATIHGVILGTAAYMSPEQAAGKAVDKRSDLWALGVVLLEMLTGKSVFTGETVSHVLAGVLAKDPDFTMLPRDTPAPIHRLLRRCLEKDRKRRIADASDVRLEIDEALAGGPSESAVSAPPRHARKWPYAAVAAVALAVGAGATVAWRAIERARPAPVYASLETPADFVLGDDDPLVHLPTRTPMVFTPDGRSLIIQVARAGQPLLVRQALDRPVATPIAGTGDARVPFVSPDGKWVGFFAANELRKVPIEGGTPTTICSLRSSLGPNGASWGARDVIVFGDPTGRIMRVSAGGGAPAPVTATPPAMRLHVAPFFLPDGTHFLFSDVSVYDAADARLMVQGIDGGDARLVLSAATDGRLLPSGRLAFMRLGAIMTTAFDLATIAVVGDPVAAMGGVMQSGLRARAGANNTSAGMFAVSSRGDLAAVRGPVVGGEESHAIWVTPGGHSSPAEPATGAPLGFRLYSRISPDQSRAMVTVIAATRFELWVVDWKRGVWTLCGDCHFDALRPPVWSPDGRSALLPNFETLVAHALDGSVPDRILVREADRVLEPRAWLADGRVVYLSSATANSPRSTAIMLLDAGAQTGRPIIQNDPGLDAEVSPDHRWLAYTSLGGDQRDIVVQPFPGPGSRTPVSSGGGANALWSVDGRTLYYLRESASHEVTAFAVDVRAADTGITVGAPREIFRNPESQVCSGRCWDVAAGPRFLLIERTAAVKRASVTRMDLVLNWTSTLPGTR